MSRPPELPRALYAFLPIDEHAKDGGCHLLQAEDGGQFCGRWDAELDTFVIHPGTPIAKPITAYCVRLTAHPAPPLAPRPAPSKEVPHGVAL